MTLKFYFPVLKQLQLKKILIQFYYNYDAKRRDITLPAKVHTVKAMVFPVVMCGCERWTIKKV